MNVAQYKPHSGPTWCYALAAISLVGGLLAATSPLGATVAVAGVVGFAFWGVMGALLKCVLDIRYLLAMQVAAASDEHATSTVPLT